jgi:hypothetical protein
MCHRILATVKLGAATRNGSPCVGSDHRWVCVDDVCVPCTRRLAEELLDTYGPGRTDGVPLLSSPSIVRPYRSPNALTSSVPYDNLSSAYSDPPTEAVAGGEQKK